MNRKKGPGYFGGIAFAAACTLAACAGVGAPRSASASVPTEQSLPPQENSELSTAESPAEAETDKEDTGTDIPLAFEDSVPVTISLSAGGEGGEMSEYDFSAFTNVEITGIELSGLSEEQLAVLYQQARYCQAMTKADIDTMDEIVSDNSVFTHMSGMQQTKEEYFADVKDGSLRYFTIGIENPVVEVNGNLATVTYISVLNANAYGARGTYRMGGTHWFENRDGVWYSINNPER